MNTPVAMIIFNRPDTTEQVFAEIARAKPPKLLVVADGPRADRPGEETKCAAARAVIHRVDWDCDVLTHYADRNMGCKQRISSGLDWVFDTVEEAIILEDDCLPHPSFFRFCEELLEKYRHDDRIGSISGNNFQFGRKRTEESYYFSRYCHIWGWATWRRAWKFYDVNLSLWPEVKEGGWLKDILGDLKQVRYWKKIFQNVADGKIDTWDYQWLFSCWVNSMLTILPNVNLISNIGFGSEATHNTRASRLANIPSGDIGFPLNHPKLVVRNEQMDLVTAKSAYNIPTGKRVLDYLLFRARAILSKGKR
ncbi:MAG: glycosyltransferase family 2 protein [Nitrospinae bacterium]|nr:glycosyltransferase family 2 protein [Nitrospinota bacterium]